MKLLTKQGIAQGVPLSDIQEYNLRLKWITLTLGSIGSAFFLYLIWVTWYIIHNHVLNNIVQRCL
jgi:hypothetical protein